MGRERGWGWDGDESTCMARGEEQASAYGSVVIAMSARRSSYLPKSRGEKDFVRYNVDRSWRFENVIFEFVELNEDRIVASLKVREGWRPQPHQHLPTALKMENASLL
jgi:hypothetical protein